MAEEKNPKQEGSQGTAADWGSLVSRAKDLVGQKCAPGGQGAVLLEWEAVASAAVRLAAARKSPKIGGDDLIASAKKLTRRAKRVAQVSADDTARRTGPAIVRHAQTLRLPHLQRWVRSSQDLEVEGPMSVLNMSLLCTSTRQKEIELVLGSLMAGK
eukprot:gnl/MRDRNA2_/MRDRNA2_25603_c0_seq2.p1 gnl/MRDRNA2_/MRDRNA2_25603_c0~~gnl/MRDRNA2_/MRDRNA2_25603_c0_seq2.p1  ORF type:complete len:169 (-),score=37.49 gnl/MRDRNA2_/MRDRNA2_25603_c0_seq2:18-488(-)